MDLKKKCLMLAVMASVMAGGMSERAWAEYTVEGDKLKIEKIYANNAQNPYFKKNNENVYVITKDDGRSFDTIEHSDKNSTGQFQFILVDSGNDKFEILANNINLESTYTDSAIYNSGIGAVISIGKKDSEVKNVNIISGYGLGNTARICVARSNNKNKFQT